ncbi:MAG: DUF1788 domain-containing protein [Candidatus Lokiarchaeota archaeon]|nr:DUF1788 domain-containing protein [Candidatus Lokiarchaeota archaeon]
MIRDSPIDEFTGLLTDFAKGKRRGIRNPHVIIPVAPPYEQRAAEYLSNWAKNVSETTESIGVQSIWLDEILPRTDVFNVIMKFKGIVENADSIRKTMHDNLASDLAKFITNTIEENSRKQILLLLKLGSLYPFAHASDILDELDRQNVKCTIGILFPGEIIAGKLSFFGKGTRHYYPAHRIDMQIRGVHIQ